ncbi:NACHT domain-containing protein [Serratia sp. NFX21]|uniref:NACHT domain-containing protein n=1 Tax=Serratia sp. NFX21 TaxID=3402279 RepID=UPI003AF3F4D2
MPGKLVEVQVKRGLKRGTNLWDALCALAKGIRDNSIACGILVVCPNSSVTIRSNLAENIVRIGTGRTDGIHAIGDEFIKRVGLEPSELYRVCSSLRIVTVDAIDGNNSAEINAINQLNHLFHEPLRAWCVLIEQARKLIRIRGRATITSLLNEFRSVGIGIKMDTTESGIQLRAVVCKWLEKSYSQFTIPGQAKPVSLQKCWIPLKASIIKDLENFPDDLSEALSSYHQYAANRTSNIDKFDAYTLGRYVTRGIIIGGPGIGKSVLLRRIALTYAAEGHMVLLAQLSQVVSLISHKGIRFEEALNDVALSCSGLRYKSLDLQDAVILCDGLDECGVNQHLVTDAIHRFAVAHPKTRILLTSRPVGYRPGLLGNWRHYELLPLEESQADDALIQVMEALPFESPEARNQTLNVAKEQLKSLHLKGIASRSPLILTMLASLSSKGIEPDSSRISLYRQLFKLLETAYPSARLEGSVPTEPERNWFIFLLGWILFEHGTEPFELTFKHCVSEWQKETQDGYLACSNKVQACFDFWENVGVIEHIHTLDQEAVTFIHKTFAEYAAAVFIERQPHNLKRNLLIKVIQGDSSRGTLSFVSHLGLVDEIIDVWSELILRGETTPTRELNQVINLIIEAGIPVNKDALRTFADCCWKAISSSSSMFSAGEALCQVSIYSWDIVSDNVRANLNSNDNWLWLVSWACTLAGNPEEVSYQDAIIALKSIHSKWPKRLKQRNSLFDFTNGRKIQDSIILGAAEIILQSPEDIGLGTLNAIIDKGKGVSANCFLKISKLYTQAGIKLQDEVNRSPYTEQDFLRSYDKINAKWLVLISVLAGDYNTSGQDDILPENMIELGAFLSASGFHHLSLSDLRCLEETDEKFIHRSKFLYKIAKSAGIELDKLRHQSAIFKRQCQGNLSVLFEYSCRLPVVDAFVKPENIKINPEDFDDLLATILYGSQFYSSLAAIILYEHRNHPRVMEGIKRILMEGEGAALHIGTQFIKDMPGQNWQQLLLQRLQTTIPEQGSSYLFGALTQPFNSQHESVVTLGLRNEFLNVVLAAASFATKLPQTDELLHELGLIYEEWKQREEPYPEDYGVIPDSPRDDLSGILVKNKDVVNNVALILDMVQEKRTKIRETGEQALLNALNEYVGLQMKISVWARYGVCKPRLLRQIITVVHLHPEAVMSLIPFLKDESAELRYAATALLNTRFIEREKIELFARELLNDTEVEIRESASIALASLHSGQRYD